MTVWEPACMSAAEYASWQEMNLRIGQPNMRASSPCRDCPLWFRTLSKSEGCCNAQATLPTGRLMLPPSGDPHVDRERARWRTNARRWRARRRAAALQAGSAPATLDGASRRMASVCKPSASPRCT